jgi:hypothetical protein
VGGQTQRQFLHRDGLMVGGPVQSFGCQPATSWFSR